MNSLAPWQIQPWQNLVHRFQQKNLPHALLFAGAAGLGKRDFAHRFAKFILCEVPSEAACDQCRACQLMQAGSHPDFMVVTLELRDEGKMRSEITIDQIRVLSNRLALTSQFGGYQIVLIYPAETMNVSAVNGLLKTLEEPNPGAIIVLVSNQPAKLPATIRSRCQRINFPIPTWQEARHWLTQQGIVNSEEALTASIGNPGLAFTWSQTGTLALREEVAKDLQSLSARHDSILDMANRWARDNLDLRLWFAACLVYDEIRAHQTKRKGSSGLALVEKFSKLSIRVLEWFDQVNRARQQLGGPLRLELVAFELLIAWRELVSQRRH